MGWMRQFDCRFNSSCRSCARRRRPLEQACLSLACAHHHHVGGGVLLEGRVLDVDWWEGGKKRGSSRRGESGRGRRARQRRSVPTESACLPRCPYTLTALLVPGALLGQAGHLRGEREKEWVGAAGRRPALAPPPRVQGAAPPPPTHRKLLLAGLKPRRRASPPSPCRSCACGCMHAGVEACDARRRGGGGGAACGARKGQLAAQQERSHGWAESPEWRGLLARAGFVGDGCPKRRLTGLHFGRVALP